MTIWKGKNKTMQKPAEFIATEDFHFGGKTIPKGYTVKQFETRNFGWTSAKSPDGKSSILARE